jgi:hypothetical protein
MRREVNDPVSAAGSRDTEPGQVAGEQAAVMRGRRVEREVERLLLLRRTRRAREVLVAEIAVARRTCALTAARLSLLLAAVWLLDGSPEVAAEVAAGALLSLRQLPREDLDRLTPLDRSGTC